MKNWIIMFMGFAPIIGEILYDHWCWRQGLDDKPTSTWLRAFAIMALALIAAYLMTWNFFLSGLFAGLFYWAHHWLFFNPLLNLTNPKRTMWERKEGELWYKKPYIMEYMAKGFAWYVTWLFVFKFDYIQGHYPTQGTWWELITSFITF